MAPVCYLDLDGVLVDFVGGALSIHQAHIARCDIRWDFWKECCVTEADFWEPLGFQFWSSLSWTPEGKELLAGVERLFGGNVVLLTSPCNTAGCVEGKRAWVKREAPHLFRNLQVGAVKELLAAPSKVLVDDNDGNVEKFAAAGGRSLLVPQPWNRLRDEAPDGHFGVSVLLNRLETILGEMRR